MQAYSDPSREYDPYALPNVEIFWLSYRDIRADKMVDGDGEYLSEGYYYQFCFPGCLPDSEPIGPFDSEDEALADAQTED